MRTALTGVALVATLAIAGCGGDDDTAPADDAAPAGDAKEASSNDGASESAEQDDAEGADAPVDEPASVVGDDIAIVTIDGTTYEVDVSLGPAPQCDPDFFGAFLAGGGDQNGFFSVLLPPPDDPNFTDEPNAKLKVGELEWIADPAKMMSGVEPGDSQIDSFITDGSSASGTATFVELNETYSHSGGGPEPTPVTGTFEVSCSG